MEKKMDENRVQMEKRMEELNISMSTILLHNLDKIFPQGYIRTQLDHVNVEEINIGPQNHDYANSPPNLHH
jgi:hypothetical protein